MCLGIPAEIVTIHQDDPAIATVAISGVTRDISIDLVADQSPSPGDWVLVHVGFAMSLIDEHEAAATLDQIKKLGGNTFEDEFDSYKESAIR
ncbi:HypC/HybG/HupF family hydrogenase formation chaperone [Devriesea agamarum]|uniref:HypC/HybG/HupF family hydrogenase formation chaperone n=1 Tax=Devriesea agamarum TaxID=472569 RepID=UPI00071CCA62|nr:HypC/HybG/HupF family hydrogenase formation chaperone [Devriesea agamarum]